MSAIIKSLSMDTSVFECGNDSLWLLSQEAAERNTFLIAGGVLMAALMIYGAIVFNFFATQLSPFKKLLRLGNVRRRELWVNMSFAVVLVALNLLLLGGIQKRFKETFITIMTVFGAFSLLCSVAGIYYVATRLSRKGSAIVQNATEFMLGNRETADKHTMFANDRYEDFGNDLFGTLWLGIAQIILLSMYVVAVYYDLVEDDTVVPSTRRMQSNETDVAESVETEYSEAGLESEYNSPIRKNIYAPFYALALFVQIGYVFGKEAVKDRYRHILFWGKAYKACWDRKAVDWKSREASTINPVELLIRSMLSILVNDVGLILLMLVLPLQLSSVNRKDCFDFADKISDFVLNAVAIYYVIEVDDMEEKTYKLRNDSDEKLRVSTSPTNSERTEGVTPIHSERDEEMRRSEAGDSGFGRESVFFDEYDISGGDDRLNHSGRSVAV